MRKQEERTTSCFTTNFYTDMDLIITISSHHDILTDYINALHPINIYYYMSGKLIKVNNVAIIVEKITCLYIKQNNKLLVSLVYTIAIDTYFILSIYAVGAVIYLLY